MVVVSQPALDHFSLIKTCSTKPVTVFDGTPVIDLSDPHAKALLVKACEEFGFFKVINHGVPMEYMTRVEARALSFFNSSQSEKDKASPPCPLGYGSKRIGFNGDTGWIEYVLIRANPEAMSQNSLSISPSYPENFSRPVSDYVSAVKEVACEVLDMITKELKIEPKNAITRLVRDEKSDSCFRINHYPPCPELQALSGRSLVGFGEHTDPQVISVLRSNATSGLQMCLKDGSWVSIPPDQHSFFINVGDVLQVLSNGRFKSVKHRVMPDHSKSRVSMIYFGGPPLEEKIAPLASMVREGEERLYKEFTWLEYKKSSHTTKLADNRLWPFEVNKETAAAGQ